MSTPSFTLDDLQRVAPQVLARLRGMAELPDYGTVAGQSVASLFWEALDLPMRGPINDIDVFVNTGLPRAMRGGDNPEYDAITQNNAQPRRVSTTTHMDVGHNEDAYGYVTRIALRCNTQILSTYRRGLVNYTLINSPFVPRGQLGHPEQVSRSLVEGFDLNLVSVGINLETGQAVASPEFLRFLKTGQIRAQTCNTPSHTLIRLANKVFGGQVTGATCDYDNERDLLESAIACRQTKKNRYDIPTPPNFGARYLEQYQKQAQHLPTLETHTLESYGDFPADPITLYQLVPGEEALNNAGVLGQIAQAENPHVITQMILLTHFPSLWRKIHAEGSEGPTAQLLGQVIGQEQDATPLIALASALDQPRPAFNVEGMTDSQQTAFFFGQRCARNPGQARQAAQAWDDMGSLEKHVTFRCQIQADDILALLEDPTYWRELLSRQGSHILATAVGATPRTGDYSNHRALLSTLMDHLETMGVAGRQIMQEGLSIQMGAGQYASNSCHNFMDAWRNDHEAREHMGQRLLRNLFPGWPRPERFEGRRVQDTSKEQHVRDTERFASAARYCADLGLAFEGDWIASLTGEEAASVILGAARGGKSPQCVNAEHAEHLMALLLERMTPEQVEENGSRVARALVESGGGKALAQWLGRQGEQGLAIRGALIASLETLRNDAANNTANTWCYTDIHQAGDDWAQSWNSATEQGLAALQRQVLLDMAHEGQAGPGRKSPRM